MNGSNLQSLVSDLLGRAEVPGREHVQTVKIPVRAHAELRALADLAGRAKTPLASDLLVAAIRDAVAALPGDPMDEVTQEKVDKLFGVVQRVGEQEPMSLREMVLRRAEDYLGLDEYDGHDRAADGGVVEAASQNGVRH